MLEGLSFTFGAGRISVILGPGGSGKSTLLKALGGGRNGTPGLWVRGRLEVPSALPGSMPQSFSPNEPSGSSGPTGPNGPTLAALLAAARCGTATGTGLRDAWRVAPEADSFLEPILDVPFHRLPPAQRRLAEFTATAAVAPLILLDEPEVDLDPDQRQWMVERLAELRGARTVVVATHHIGLARAVADAAILLCDGRLVEAGQAPAFFDRPHHERTRHFVQMGS